MVAKQQARRVRPDLEHGDEADDGGHEHGVEHVQAIRVPLRERVGVDYAHRWIDGGDVLQHPGHRCPAALAT
jgi:hypothetical protein